MSEGSIQYDEIWQQMSDGFRLSNLMHGPPHWKQVEQNGLEIAETSRADLVVVRLFAVLHDSQRWNDGYDPEHGIRAAEVAAACEVNCSRSPIRKWTYFARH